MVYITVCGGDRIFLEYSSQGNSSGCKWSQEGSEYSGNQSVTFVGEICRSWTDSNYPDDLFPDGSRAAARNYCRNPSDRESGPWCYPVRSKAPTGASSEPEDCAIRLCSVEKCRRTGSGAEFAGEIDRSTSGSKCLKWSTVLKNKKSRNSDIKKFTDEAFPELSRKWARNLCRNPDSSDGGPWCYVQDDAVVRREYCDIPFCDDQLKLVTTALDDVDTFINLTPNDTQLSLSVRLWNPRSWRSADFKVIISRVAIPLTSNELWSSRLGFQVDFTHFQASLAGSAVKTTPLWATQWTNLTLRWDAKLIKVYRDEKSLFSLKFPLKTPMSYFALAGRNVMWDVEGGELATGGDSPRQMRPMVRSPTGYRVDVWVRSRGGACVHLQETPTVPFPRLKLCLDDLNSTAVYYQREVRGNSPYRTYPRHKMNHPHEPNTVNGGRGGWKA